MQSPNQNHLILEMDKQDKIKLGKRRPGVHKQDRLDRQHEDAMAGKEVKTERYGSGIDIQSYHKESADPFPHTCRYYRGCTPVKIGLFTDDKYLDNSVQNQLHFNDFHPLTIDEEHFYLTIYRQQPNGRTAYKLSILYGRSQDTIKQILNKNGILTIPKWTKRAKEIEELHQDIRINRATIVHEYTNLVEQQTLLDTEDTFPIPTDVESIQRQNYLEGWQFEQPNALTQMEEALTAGKQLMMEYTSLKAWKIDAEQREREHLQEIEELRTYAQHLDKLVTQFAVDYDALIDGFALEDKDNNLSPTV